MWWKVVYDAKTPTWQAYGRVAFVQADSEAAARIAGEAFAKTDYPESRIEIDRLGESTDAAAEAYFEKRRRLKTWQENAKRGVFNDPKSL